MKIAYNTIFGPANHEGGLATPRLVKMAFNIPFDGLYTFIQSCAMATEDKSIGIRYIFLNISDPLILAAKIKETVKYKTKLSVEKKANKNEWYALSQNLGSLRPLRSEERRVGKEKKYWRRINE